MFKQPLAAMLLSSPLVPLVVPLVPLVVPLVPLVVPFALCMKCAVDINSPCLALPPF